MSVCPSLRPSDIHSCPLHIFDTVRDDFTKLGTNVKHDQTTCRDKQQSLHLHFGGIIPLCNFQCRNRVRSITLIPFEIISQNLVQIYSMTRRRAEINNGHSTYIFCGIIPLCNFQYRNRVHSITLIPFEIISQNLVQI